MKIILTGISSVDTLIIKNLFQRHSDGKKIEWVGMDHTEADALICPEGFLYTPTVEFLLATLSDRVVVGIVRRKGETAVVEGENWRVLDLGGMKIGARREWVASILGGVSNIAGVRKYLSEHEQEDPSSSRCEEKRRDPSPGVVGGISSTFHGSYILDAVRGGREICVTANGTQIYLSPKRRSAAVNHRYDNVPGINTCERIECREVVSSLPNVFELDQWLWESLWNADIDFEQYVDTAAAYRLKRWPQPRGLGNRAISLRVSGAIQKSAASSAQLAKRFNYSEAEIARFLYTMELVGFAEKSTERGGILRRSKPNKERLGLLSRIRQKLNLAR